MGEERTDVRFVQCPACNGEGRMVTGTRHHPGNWYEPPETEDIVETCNECGGSGWVAVHVEPIEIEDLPA